MWNCRALLLDIRHAHPTHSFSQIMLRWHDWLMVSPSLRTVFLVHDDVTPARTGFGTHAQLEVDGIHQVGHFIIVHELGAVQDHVIHASLEVIWSDVHKVMNKNMELSNGETLVIHVRLGFSMTSTIQLLFPWYPHGFNGIFPYKPTISVSLGRPFRGAPCFRQNLGRRQRCPCGNCV